MLVILVIVVNVILVCGSINPLELKIIDLKIYVIQMFFVNNLFKIQPTRWKLA